MTAPSSDKTGIRQTIRALEAAGYTLGTVDYGDEMVAVSTEAEAVDAVMAVDDAILYVIPPNGVGNPWVRFVLGNDPDEVICDHTVSLSPVLDPLMDAWLSV